MTPEADVIIAGAGPAGCLAAYRIAKRGARVLVLEKETFPRYKVCGAGITHKVLQEVPYSLDPVIETRISSIRFSCHFREAYTKTSPDPMMYCTMRERMDAFMLGQASDAGARVIFGAKVTGLTTENNYHTVSTPEGQYHARIVIGADGASGSVARLAGLRRSLAMGLAWEGEVETDPETLERFSSTVFLDWGTFPGGYGWIFPKRDHFSVGVGGPAELSARMMPYYEEFTRSTGLRITGTRSLRSWPIPVRTARGPFHHGTILVTGDAAGLTDPLTGEGICNAVISANLAAEAALDYLSGRASSFDAYSREVNERLMTEVLEAGRIRYIFNTVPFRIHRLVRDNERVWRAFGKILRGERHYADVQGGLRRWSRLWGLICRLSGIVYYCKKRFPWNKKQYS